MKMNVERRTSNIEHRSPQSSAASDGGCARRAFTLVEMLAVMAIIAILAALVVGGVGLAMEKMRTSRVEGELNKLVLAIENYKLTMGSYPPDHATTKGNRDVYAPTSQLFYELTGAILVPERNEYTDHSGRRLLTLTEFNLAFGRGGIANSSPDPERVHQFLRDIDPRQHDTVTVNGVGVELFVVPVELESGQTNFWRYDSSSDRRKNPDRFDLWAEISIGGKTRVIGNWKE